MVSAETFCAGPVSGNMDPEKISWMIRRKGITVMAVVVDFTTDDTARPIISAA